MIKINKFEHVFGIKKLNNPELIKNNSIIYSPNGVMKSSLTDGLFLISKNENPKDIFNDIESTFEVENNGILINENSSSKQLDLLTFKGEDLFDSVFSNKNIAKIVVSTSLKKQYESKLASIQSKLDYIKDTIAVNVLEEKKQSKASKINDFLNVYDGNSDIEKISNLLNQTHNDIKEDTSSVSYSSLFNSKTEPVLNDSAFKKKAEEYQALKDIKLNEKIFNNGFSIQELQNTQEVLIKNKYYDAGHKLSIDNESYDKIGVEKLITDSVKTAYGSEEMKTAFFSAKSVLEKNADSRKIVKAISDNAWLLEKLVNPQGFKKDLFFNKIESHVVGILEAKKDIDEAKKDIQKILDEAKTTEPTWKKVVETYNQRFYNKHFDLIIANQANALLGIQEPVFKKVFKGSGVDITDEIFERFSSGEKRAIFILYFLFEIELKNTIGLNYTIVVDDIVDSFDYKNKYAMIEYLSELASDTNIQLIILTHNFDFYRSCRHSFGYLITSQLFAYLDANEEVSLFDSSSNNYESFQLFNAWKRRDDIASLITLIPFIRNLAELKEGESSTNYVTLCDFLHFNLNTANIDLLSISNLFHSHGVLHAAANSTRYWTLLINEVKSIVSPVVESDIQKKILLGMFIRLSSDYLLLTKYRINNGGNDPIIQTGSNWTKKLKLLAYSYLDDEEKKLYNRAVTVAPSFVHVNSFMYEPLIDVGSEKLLIIANELITLNGF
jgi:hypothetical protein